MIPDVIETILRYRNGNMVKRYHTVDLLVPETVGHHSANVALLCLAIDPEASANLLKAALLHDLGEQYTGDIPAQAKWQSPDLAKAAKELEDRLNLDPIPSLTKHEQKVLKQADALDCFFKMREELRKGNNSVAFIMGRIVDRLFSTDPLHVTQHILEVMSYDGR